MRQGLLALPPARRRWRRTEVEAVASRCRLHTAVLQSVNATGALGCCDCAVDVQYYHPKLPPPRTAAARVA